MRTWLSAVGVFMVAVSLIGCSTDMVELRDQDVTSPGSSDMLTGIDREFGQNMVSCLHDSGWDATLGPDNSYQIDGLQQEQLASFQSAERECAEKFGYDQQASPSVSQLRAIYAALVDARTCLQNEGFVIDEPPSEQAFLDGSVFDPYSALKDPSSPQALSVQRLEEVLRRCPRP